MREAVAISSQVGVNLGHGELKGVVGRDASAYVRCGSTGPGVMGVGRGGLENHPTIPTTRRPRLVLLVLADWLCGAK